MSVTFDVERPDFERLRKLADKEGSAVAQVLRQVLKAHLKRLQRR